MSSILDAGITIPSNIIGETASTTDTAVSQAVQAETTNSITDEIQQALGYHPNPVGQTVQNAFDSLVNLFKFGNVSHPVDTSVQTPRISTSFNPNLLIGSAATVGTTAIVYSTVTNPNLNTTIQTVSKQNAGAIQNLSDAVNSIGQSLLIGAKTTQSVLSSQYAPLLLIGGLVLAGVFLFKQK